jgi:hypothetical protein
MRRALLLGLLAALLAPACATPPGDAAQIRRLIRDQEAALARGDTRRLYRLHDPDFRAVCPLDRFRALPHEAVAVAGVREVETRGSRGWATVELAAGGSERRAFVKDAGRWYVYADAAACRPGSTFHVPGSTVHRSEPWLMRCTVEPGTWNVEPPPSAVAAHG